LSRTARHLKPIYPRTPRQREILLFVRDYMAGTGMSPNYSEIAAKFRISVVTVHEHIHLMKRARLLTLRRYQERSITLSPRLVLCEGKGVCPTCGRPITEGHGGNGVTGHVGTKQAAR
jgi:SOS-response transcriptional repressor LexA